MLTQATAVTIFIVAWTVRHYASLLLVRVVSAEESRRKYELATSPAVMLDVPCLDRSRYDAFVRAIGAAEECEGSLVVRLPSGLALPRPWIARVGTTQLMTAIAPIRDDSMCACRSHQHQIGHQDHAARDGHRYDVHARLAAAPETHQSADPMTSEAGA